MKKIILIICISYASLFADSSLDNWFNEKYSVYSPYLLEVDNYYYEGTSTAQITILNKNKNKLELRVITYADDIGKEKSLAMENCPPIIKNKNGVFKVKYFDYCKNRFNLNGYKRYIRNYMKTLERALYNGIHMSYREDPTKEFIITNQKY